MQKVCYAKIIFKRKRYGTRSFVLRTPGRYCLATLLSNKGKAEALNIKGIGKKMTDHLPNFSLRFILKAFYTSPQFRNDSLLNYMRKL